MEVEFKDDDLDRLEVDGQFKAGFDGVIVTAFRKRMQQIRDAVDERDFFASRALNFEKLKGDREGQYSMRLNKQWRLIVELDNKTSPKTVVIIEIVDYH